MVISSHLDYLSFKSERRQEQKVDQDGDQAVKETWSSKLLKFLRFISQVYMCVPFLLLLELILGSYTVVLQKPLMMLSSSTLKREIW
jgi:hypothetical protein